MIRTIKNDIFAGGILILLAFTLSLVHLGSPDLKLGSSVPRHCRQQPENRPGSKTGSPFFSFRQDFPGPR